MYEELVTRLRELASIPEHCETVDDCSQCTKESICLSYTNERIIDVATKAADAIEELQQTVEHYKGCSDDWYKVACDYKAMLPHWIPTKPSWINDNKECDCDTCSISHEELSKPRWIPVAERLPEKRKWVLCKCQANIVDVLRFENAEWYHDPTHVYMYEFVTHWMPLPEPPKEET